MEINCVFAPAVDTAEHIQYAEELGYTRAWVYDSPTIYADAGATVALAAARTTRIRLGISVITAHMRHLAANAGLVAYLATLAHGRFDIGVGSGFTSSALLARKPSKWADVEAYVVALRALLAGKQVQWDGAVIQLQHGLRSGVRIPVDVPVWVAAHGPKGFAAAGRVADGVVSNPTHGDQPVPFDGACNLTYYGTVMDDDEDFDSPRVHAAAGAGAALALHMGRFGPLAGMPEAEAHERAIGELPEDVRHLAMHGGHLIEPNSVDRRFITADVIRRGTLTGTRAQIAERLRHLEEAGATAVLFQPSGPDVRRELAAFWEAAHTATETPSSADTTQSIDTGTEVQNA